MSFATNLVAMAYRIDSVMLGELWRWIATIWAALAGEQAGGRGSADLMAA